MITMTIEEILKLDKSAFENYSLTELGLDLSKDVQKIRLLSQWYNTYNRSTTPEEMRLAIIENLKRLLCIP
jgi:hypothetical protein